MLMADPDAPCRSPERAPELRLNIGRLIRA